MHAGAALMTSGGVINPIGIGALGLRLQKDRSIGQTRTV
jgi:hypothetical protein